ncbi:MAG TPA: dihydroorotate dehydrogenase electron transfer subunit [Prolixibacteraceae bacterium]
MKKTVRDLQVISNIRLNKDHSLLELKSDIRLEGIVPGQFANILVDKATNTFLRRPFSIHQVDYKCNTISFLIKGIGEGTNCLLNSSVGDKLNVIFPLGRGFSVPKNKSKVLLVGGGVGLAPLLLLAGLLKEARHAVEVLLGARSVTDLVELDFFSKYAIVHTTTEDGTHGTKGFVTNHAVMTENVGLYDRIYTCGPDPMMKEVARIARINQIECEVSLENSMACGYGVCLCCITETIEGHKCVCTEGPVFDIKYLKW